MGFLDDLLKDVEKGIDRVQKGADKLLSEQALRSEIEKLKHDQHEILAEIGEEAVALYAAGEIALPGMNVQIAQLRDIRARIEASQNQLTEMRETTAAGAPEPAPAPEPAQPVPSAERAVPVAFCAECGAQLTEGAAFCPECGHKVA